jgi:hypothetical protein
MMQGGLALHLHPSGWSDRPYWASHVVRCKRPGDCAPAMPHFLVAQIQLFGPVPSGHMAQPAVAYIIGTGTMATGARARRWRGQGTPQDVVKKIKVLHRSRSTQACSSGDFHSKLV